MTELSAEYAIELDKAIRAAIEDSIQTDMVMRVRGAIIYQLLRFQEGRVPMESLDKPSALAYSVDELGTVLGVGRNTAYKVAKKLPHFRIGKKIRIPVRAVEKLLCGEDVD